MSDLSKIQWILWVSLACVLPLGHGFCPAAVSDNSSRPYNTQVSAAGVAVVINEVLASNSAVMRDPQNQYDDWIELYNPGAAAVDVAGMYVTDDLDNPTQWRFPLGHPELTTIPPQGFLLFWADGETADPGLHASFRLSADGETIGLYDRDGITLVDSVSFGRQTPNVSYGRYPDGTADLLVMAWPTPGEKNIRTYAGAVAEPQFSRARGFCDSAFTLELTTPTEGASIYYKLDGTDPLAGTGRSGATGIPYTGPISISRTTCVRAAAVKAGWMPSPTVTATYIFLNDVIHQPANPAGFPNNWGSTRVDYAMDSRVVDSPTYASTIKNDLKTIPSVSVVLGNDDFFGAQRGIYANTQAHGIAWERAASIEWIDPVKKADFQVNVGLRLHGSQYGRTASVAKHSLRILFKSEYGPSKLKYPLFEDSDVDQFDNLVLRAIWNYSWFGDSTACSGIGTSHADYLRDLYSRDTVRDLDRLNPRGRPVHVYINGLYWGLYILSERPDEGFASIHLGGTNEDYDVLYANGAMETVAGDQTAWNTLLNLATADLSTAKAYEAIQKLLDVPAMIDYLLMIYYTGSRDAPVLLCNNQSPRNFYALRSRNPAGPFVFLPWDVEWTLESPTENRVTVVGQANPHYFLNRLNANPDFRILLADRIYEQFFNDGPLTTAQATARYMARATEIDRAIVGESARWGDSLRSNQPYTRTDWIAERDRLVNQYFSIRTNNVMNQLRQAGFYPAVSPPTFLVNGWPQRGGHIANTDTVILNASSGTIWYTLDGSDPRASESKAAGAIPPSGVSPTAIRYTGPFTLNASAHLKTRVLSGNTWSALNEVVFAVGPVAENLRISEIMYHPANTGDVNDPNTEYLELTNIGKQTINLNLVQFAAGIDFTFPSFNLAPAGYCLVVKDLAAFRNKYSPTLPVAGQYAGNLSNAGEQIELEDAAGKVILQFQYRDDWFSKTDGGGFSLTVKDPVATDPNQLSDESVWRPSTQMGGTPGAADHP